MFLSDSLKFDLTYFLEWTQ